MRQKPLLKIATAALFICFFNMAAASQNVRIERTEEHAFKAKSVDQQYQIQVYLPPGYENAAKNFAVLYLLDADKSFGMAKDIVEWLAWAREIREIVIIGIAYGEGTKAWWDKRSRDYAPWKDRKKVWGDWPLAGGAGNFLKFLREELIPWVDSNYRTDRNDRALAGLSLGGLFAAYTLFAEPQLFSKYLLSGAALIWDERHIFKTEEEFSKGHDSLPIRLYSAVGELDEKAITRPWEDFCTIITKRNYRGLQTKWEVIPGETHISSWPASFTRGIKHLYGKSKLDGLT